MSTIRVPIVPITDIRPHSNPEVERLEVATVEGWQLVTLKGQFQEGDRVAYFEQGTTIPLELAERLNIVPYLSNKTDINGDRVLVIHRIRLKGEASFGLAVTVPEQFADYPDGTDLSDYFGATKYMPPIKAQVTDAEMDHPLFPRYTDIENLRSYPHIFTDGEMVVVMTEKIHGTNVRVGFVDDAENGFTTMAGSRTLRRKIPEDYNTWAQNVYWHPWTTQGVTNFLAAMHSAGHKQAVVFGEVYGTGIQNYTYGERGLGFRAFDIMIDGEYVCFDEFELLCRHYEINMVPILYIGAYDLATIASYSNGESLLGGTHGREGGVVRPFHQERFDPQIGRVILKYVGDDYLFSKIAMNGDTTDV